MHGGSQVATQRKPAGLAPLPAAEWESVRLTFKRSMIEQLKPSQSFRVSTREGVFGDVLRRHAIHPEAKAAGPDGRPCGPHTDGELRRLHVHVVDVKHIGKESRDLEGVQAGLDTAASTYVHYVNERVEWKRDRETLKVVPRKLLAKRSGLHVRSIKAILNTTRLPHTRHRRILHEIAEKLRKRDPDVVESTFPH